MPHPQLNGGDSRYLTGLLGGAGLTRHPDRTADTKEGEQESAPIQLGPPDLWSEAVPFEEDVDVVEHPSWYRPWEPAILEPLGVGLAHVLIEHLPIVGVDEGFHVVEVPVAEVWIAPDVFPIWNFGFVYHSEPPAVGSRSASRSASHR